jgi:iron complex outermembrane recepter protein
VLAGRFLDGAPLGTNGTLPTQRRSETNVSGNVTAQYFVDDGPVLYATASRGYKAGGYNSRVLSQARLAFLTFEPEESTNFELGAKFVWPRVAGYLNVAAFYTRFTNLQVETNNQVAGATFLTTANAASARNRGIELEGGISPTDGLTLNMSFAYLIAKYGNYASAPCQVGQVAPACVAGSQDLSGRRFGRPPLNASLSAQYEVPLSAGVNGLVRGDYRFSDAYNASDDLDPRARIRAVDLLNARIGIQHPDGNWSVAAWARNLTNERYFAGVFDAPLQGGSFVGVLAERRSFGVEASVRF